jgi:6-pyruvoyltetrahydropterin/6-carboxytetrahydropterin synthase
LLLLLRSGSVHVRSGFFAAISAAATLPTPPRPLTLNLRSRSLLLRRSLRLRRTLRLRTTLLRTTAAALRALWPPIASTLARLLLLRTRVGTRRLRSAAPLILLAGTLLELLQLLLHVPANRSVLPRPHLIETAVGTALPAFGIGLLAGCAKDAFWQGHRRAGALYTSAVEPSDDTARRKTLQTLIELAERSNPADCWDDRRAEDLLRSQSTPNEVRELGMSEEMIARVWGVGSGESEKKTTNTDVISHTPRPTPHSPRFTVRVSARFEAAHFLREYRGISEPLHGHSYKVEADLASRAGGVDSDAIAVDFVSARQKLEALAKTLDYGCINDVPPFDRINPSAENIAEWFARELGAAVAGEDAIVQAVTIWEGPVNSVTFRP